MKLTLKSIGLAPPNADSLTVSTDALTDYVSTRKLRRMDHFTRMTLLAAYRTLDNGDCLDPLPDDMGIIISTGYGPAATTFDFLDSIIDDGAPLASPLAFSHSVHNIPAGVLSMLLGTPCPQTTICQHRRPVLAGLRNAVLWLAEGRVKNVLFGCVDETTMLLAENMKRLREAGELAEGMPPGEGAVFFLLDSCGNGIGEIDLVSYEADEDEAVMDESKPWGEIPVGTAFEIAQAISAKQGGWQRIIEHGEAFRVHGDSLG